MGNNATKRFNMIPLPFEELLLINKSWWSNQSFRTFLHPYLKHVQDESDLSRILALPENDLLSLISINSQIIVVDFQGNTNTVETQKDRPILVFLAQTSTSEKISTSLASRDDVDLVKAPLSVVALSSGAVSNDDLNKRNTRRPRQVERSAHFSNDLTALISEDDLLHNGTDVSLALLQISSDLNDVHLCVIYSRAWDKSPKKNEDTVIGKLIQALREAV